jgi:nucleoside-diphosphate-sugar epimerase
MLTFFKSVKLGIKPAFGCSQSHINFTYVKDIARAVVPAITADVPSGSVYFVAEKKSYSYSQAGDIIGSLLGKRAIDLYVPEFVLGLAGRVSEQIAKARRKPVIFTADKVHELVQKYWLFDTSKGERELGLTSTDFKTGAAETIAWYKGIGWL